LAQALFQARIFGAPPSPPNLLLDAPVLRCQKHPPSAMAVSKVVFAALVAGPFVAVSEAANIERATIQQGTCKHENGNGGRCVCSPKSSPEACFSWAQQWLPMAAVEFWEEDNHCSLFQLWEAQPQNCPEGCVAMAGTGTGTYYGGDRRSGTVCMTSWESANTIMLHGACRFGHSYGGLCSCSPAQSAPDCFRRAKRWFPMAAAEYRIQDQACNLYQLSADAPSACPNGCRSLAGRSNVPFYSGNSIAESMCLVSAGPSKFTVQQGQCSQHNNTGGFCMCFDHTKSAPCFAQAQEWPSMEAASFHTEGESCVMFHRDIAAPNDCPAGCLARPGTATVTFYVGDGLPGWLCMSAPSSPHSSRALPGPDGAIEDARQSGLI